MPVNERETTRTREQGTEVTNTQQSDNPGQSRIDSIRRIVEREQYAKIDGILIDLYSAGCILNVYDNLPQETQAKMRNLSMARMADVAFKILAKVR